MKRFYSVVSMLWACLLCTMAQSVPSTPQADMFTDYKGTSFLAKWKRVSGASDYLLDVFSRADKDTKIDESFEGVNATDGKIDQTNPNYPEGWEANVSTVVDDSGVQKIKLCKSGEYFVTPQFDGPITKMVVWAHIEDEEAVNNDNSSVMVINVYDASGESIIRIDGYMSYFTYYHDLDVFEVIGSNWETITAVKFGIEHRDGHSTGDVVIDRFEIEHVTPEYVMQGEEVKTTSKLVENLDTETVYWYDVRAQNAVGVSGRSEMVRVDGFLTPEVVEATDVTSDSYVANWLKTPKAENYIVRNFKVKDGKGTVAMAEDHFTKATKGTFDDPVMLDTTDEADQYADLLGWRGNLMLVANGMLGADKAVNYRLRGWLETPPVDLRACSGKYKVHIKARGMKGDRLTVYPKGAYDPTTAHVMAEFASDGAVVDETWSCTGGTNDLVLSIEPRSQKFFVEEFAITQYNAQGLVVKTLVSSETTRRGVTAQQFTGLEPGQEYGYSVKAVRYNYLDYDEESEESVLMRVKLTDENAINDVKADELRVSSEGNRLHVNIPRDGAYDIYDLQGRLLFHISSKAGRYTFPVPAAGVYLVKSIGARD